MIIYDEPNDVYHANPAYSSSDAKLFAVSPQKLRDRREGISVSGRSAAMSLGTAVHQMVLEPDADPEWVVKPAGLDMRTKAGKEWKAENDGKIALSADEYDGTRYMLDRMPGACRDLLDSAPKREASVRTLFAAGGVHVQCRPDAWSGGVAAGSLIVDLKTTSDIDGFANQIPKYGYDISAGWYAAVIAEEFGDDTLPDWAWLVCETVSPYRWRIVTAEPRDLAAWRQNAWDIMHDIGSCERSDDWSDRGLISTTYQQPEWRAASLGLASSNLFK